ncbi:unnamed protein product [Prorocentrum cordatum]|uniref:Uncharacterized protein n=1 Tax=Prorocentrum cordatum TaxID=2364126 RepID=A0ABN9SGK7_9DINO|nr:unnamed protein product [Polarella glacialis]
MRPLVLALALLLRGVCSGRLGGPATQLTQQLQAIQEGVEKVGDEDQKAHEKLACWCKTKLEEKERAVEDAKEQLSSLQSTIEAQTAEISHLEAELKQHTEDIGENVDSLNEAKAIRDKTSSQFAKDEANHVANLDALDSAMKAIAKGSGISTALVVVRQVARRTSQEQRARTTARAALLREGGTLDAASSPEVVYGVLKRMHATFTNDLEGMRADASDTVRQELVRVKAKMVHTLQEQLESKKMRAASAKVQVTQRQAQLDKSQELLQVGTRLVAAMSELCSGDGEAFDNRQSLRQEELRALADARAESRRASASCRGAPAAASRAWTPRRRRAMRCRAGCRRGQLAGEGQGRVREGACWQASGRGRRHQPAPGRDRRGVEGRRQREGEVPGVPAGREGRGRSEREGRVRRPRVARQRHV